VFGKKRYDTTDDSRNNWLLALLTMGEGWHNNHHHYQSTANQGFFWWEVDLSYYIIKMLSWAGLVWDLRKPPQRVLDEGMRPAKAAKAKQAMDLRGPSIAPDIAG
jgi:stearoyl-CoA desaturase (delta-9 desaturase)